MALILPDRAVGAADGGCSDVDPAELRRQLGDGLAATRDRTRSAIAPFPEDVLRNQHDHLMSPLVWDVAHIANYEDLWLVRALGGAATPAPGPKGPLQGPWLDDLYDAFKQPRRGRSELPILGVEAALAYGDAVRARSLDRLAAADLAADGPEPLLHRGFVYAMVVQHEQQHIETLLAAIQLLPDQGARALPSAGSAPGEAVAATWGAGSPVDAEQFVPAGPFPMGSDHPWAYDNERPNHERWVDAFHIDTFPVTNGHYAAFVDAGGYRDARWWSPDGWAWRLEAGLSAPQFWHRASGAGGTGWWRERFGRVEPLPDQEPVQHVCWFEADAYARWAGKRLPTEAEWEKAAAHDPATGSTHGWPWGAAGSLDGRANLGGRRLGPAPVGSYPHGASAYGCQQMMGDVWEWTSSDFEPHPGFVAFPYEEYSSVFHGTGYKVLRGGSWATDPSACRTTFRNWDRPIRRQIFAGFRCARSAAPEVSRGSG